MKASDIQNIVHSYDAAVYDGEYEITHLLTDSRKLVSQHGTIFFAIPTTRNSGCRYIEELYGAGVRNFVVPTHCEIKYDDANIWRVQNVIEALQQIAAVHRQGFHIPIVGVTGSNGKTIVKDWLVQLLSVDRRVCANPKSYNSQIGVPLSVWQLERNDSIGVFEAGISEAGEMPKLEKVIKPTIGIFTNIGQSHDENFLTRGQKVAEKLQLFTHCETLIYCTDHKDIHSVVANVERFHHIHRFTWGTGDDADVLLASSSVNPPANPSLTPTTTLTIEYNKKQFDVQIPFIDQASQENAMHCIVLLLLLGYPTDVIAQRCAKLTPVEMRLEMNEALGNCLLINDSYSLDINSLSIALDYLQHVQLHHNKTLILSDLLQSGIPDRELYSQVAALIRRRGITALIGIGDAISHCKDCFDDIEASFFVNTQQFIDDYDFSHFTDQTILLKGARMFAFEHIAKLLQRKNHETVMEVNLDSLVHNLNYFRSKLKPATRLMAMVKASSYGAGRVEVASALQFNHVDYLTVAYADEGVELRRGGITLPIMVMNPEEASFDDIIRFRLEPDIYSFRIMRMFAERVALHQHEQFAVHVEFDTGMHRLGFGGEDLPKLIQSLKDYSAQLRVVSVFTHLACADDPEMDDFTRKQIDRFREWSKDLPGIKHILNSSGISRFTDAQMDMVRLGIGLYGIAPEPEVQAELRQVSRLVSRVSQVKNIPQGDTVGYNQRWRAKRDSRIAIIPIGYADGLHRGLGYGCGRVLIGKEEAPVIGSICMDMCFVDVTDIKCEEGDRVVIFGEGDLLQRNAKAADTITYELLTAVAPRVKRVYYHEE